MTYFEMWLGSDGDVGFYETTVDNVRNHLLDDEVSADNPCYLASVPKNHNVMYWPRGYLLIKGDIIVPRPTQVATDWEID